MVNVLMDHPQEHLNDQNIHSRETFQIHAHMDSPLDSWIVHKNTKEKND